MGRSHGWTRRWGAEGAGGGGRGAGGAAGAGGLGGMRGRKGGPGRGAGAGCAGGQGSQGAGGGPGRVAGVDARAGGREGGRAAGAGGLRGRKGGRTGGRGGWLGWAARAEAGADGRPGRVAWVGCAGGRGGRGGGRDARAGRGRKGRAGGLCVGCAGGRRPERVAGAARAGGRRQGGRRELPTRPGARGELTALFVGNSPRTGGPRARLGTLPRYSQASPQASIPGRTRGDFPTFAGPLLPGVARALGQCGQRPGPAGPRSSESARVAPTGNSIRAHGIGREEPASDSDSAALDLDSLSGGRDGTESRGRRAGPPWFRHPHAQAHSHRRPVVRIG